MKFVTEIQEKAKAVLEKAQEEMKKYTDRKRAEVNKHRVRDLVMLSTKNLKYQMVRRRTKKLMERFIGFYRIKKIVLSNAIELKLPSMVKIHLVVVTNFIRPYLHQFSIDSHGLNGYGKPLKRPFDRYQSRLEVINNG